MPFMTQDDEEFDFFDKFNSGVVIMAIGDVMVHIIRPTLLIRYSFASQTHCHTLQ